MKREVEYSRERRLQKGEAARKIYSKDVIWVE